MDKQSQKEHLVQLFKEKYKVVKTTVGNPIPNWRYKIKHK